MRTIVVGAGPGGATAALALAQAGAEVALIERARWPREKTCGDGVSPLGLRELRALGLAPEGAVRLTEAIISTPRGTAFVGGWPAETPWGTTIERRSFDAQLVDAAVAAGAAFHPETEVRSLANDGDGVRATVRSGGVERELRAEIAIIGDGATGGLPAQLGFPPLRSRLIALRGYVDAPEPLVSRYGLFYDRIVSPGYGWVFPMDRRRANIGILVDERALAPVGGSARALLERWLAESRFARDLLGERPQIDGLRGGVIPTGRRQRVRGRIFLIGDAAGVADPFTAEGIFQAIRSARLAASSLAAHVDLQRAGSAYERALREFDRNEHVARVLRATFAVAIEPYARRAARRRSFADRLNTDVFFPKQSFPGFVWRLARAWPSPENARTNGVGG